jgi:antitoxin VapB
MDRAKVINKGENQEIYLPQNCHFDTDEVWINRIGNIVMLLPKENKWESMISSLDMFTDDFLIEGIPALPI